VAAGNIETDFTTGQGAETGEALAPWATQ